MGKSQVEAMESAQQEAAAEVNQPSRKPMSLWSFLIFFLHGGLSNATFIFIVIYIFYAPQGDALQQGTEGMEYVVLHFASSEDVNDLYLKPPFCKVGIWN